MIIDSKTYVGVRFVIFYDPDGGASEICADKASAEKWIREYVQRGWNAAFDTSMEWPVTQADIDEFSRECGGRFVLDEPREMYSNHDR